MDERRKNAYRYLLFWAMLEIRQFAWASVRWSRAWNPLYWRNERRRVRYAGVLADWLHNLALFSSLDFVRFEEDWFWNGLECAEKHYPEFGLRQRYHEIFQRQLDELRSRD